MRWKAQGQDRIDDFANYEGIGTPHGIYGRIKISLGKKYISNADDNRAGSAD
jgi:hypothetical protein